MPLQEHDIPTVVITNDPDFWESDVSTSVIYYNTSSGTEEVFIDFSLYEIGFFDLIDTLLEIEILGLESSYTDIIDEIRTSLLRYEERDTLTTFLTAIKNGTADDLEVTLFFTGPLKNAIRDTGVELKITIGTIPEKYDIDVELYISGANYFKIPSDIYCSTATASGIDVDILQDTGRLIRIDTDLYSSALTTREFFTDIYSSMSGTSSGIHTELTTISGELTSMATDIFSTAVSISGALSVDFKTRSLYTGDFFLERDRFTTASSIAWVDIVDYLYPVDISKTYLYVEDVVASGIYFESIDNGYRLYYDPLDDFSSDGVLTYSLHTENVMGEIEERNFYLLYGYDLQLDEVIKWPANKKILVRAEADNIVFCSNTEGIAYDFTTVDLSSMNLRCMITPVGYEDLTVQIFPQSTAFYYGETYTVTLKNVKDYAGNIMPDLEYTFTIEDPLA